MFDAFRLIPALQVIFEHEIEFDEESFATLTAKQLAAYERRHGKPSETLYRATAFEPQAIERTEEKVTLELSIVTDSERQLLLDGVAFVYHSSKKLDPKNPTFAERLAYLRPRLPPIVTSQSETPP